MRSRPRRGGSRRRRVVRRSRRSARGARRPSIRRANSSIVTGKYRCDNVNAAVIFAGETGYHVSQTRYLLLPGCDTQGGSIGQRALMYKISPSFTQLLDSTTGNTGFATYAAVYDNIRVRGYKLILRPPQGIRSIFTTPVVAGSSYPELGALPNRFPSISFIDVDGDLTVPYQVPADGDYTDSVTQRYGARWHSFGKPIIRSLYPRHVTPVLLAGNTGGIAANTVNSVRKGSVWLTDQSKGMPFMGCIELAIAYNGSNNTAPYNQPNINYSCQSIFTIDFRMPIYG